MKPKTETPMMPDTLAATARRIIEAAAGKMDIPVAEFVRRVRGEARP